MLRNMASAVGTVTLENALGWFDLVEVGDCRCLGFEVLQCFAGF